jgi:hypothetical protein
MTQKTIADKCVPNRTAGIMLIMESFAIFVPMTIMGAAFNWPENLSLPAAYNLQLVAEQADAVQTGYLTYLLYSSLFFVAILMAAQVTASGQKFDAALNLAAGFAALSALARSLGIVRWLSVMPVLADVYATGSPEAQEMALKLYDAFNAYGGAIGELLGVSMFASFAMFALAIGMLRASHIPRWLAYFGLTASVALLLQSLELFGIELNSVLMVSFLQFWMLAAGIVFLRMKPKR